MIGPRSVTDAVSRFTGNEPRTIELRLALVLDISEVSDTGNSRGLTDLFRGRTALFSPLQLQNQEISHRWGGVLGISPLALEVAFDERSCGPSRRLRWRGRRRSNLLRAAWLRKC